MTATVPNSDDANVSIDAVLKIVFSEPVDFATVSAATITTSPAVAGSFSIDGDTVTLQPAASLTYDQAYTVTVTTGVADPAGNHTAANYEWSFQTEVDPQLLPPRVIETIPAQQATGVSISTIISASFSKDMDPATINATTFTMDHDVTGTVSYANRVATFTPDVPLDYSISYTATISMDVNDTS